MQHIQLLVCPFCREVLEKQGNVLICVNKHTFDIAKEGYVNLLRKKLPGDTKEMLLARRAFLEGGFYQPLSDAINGLVADKVQGFAQPVSLLDAGCGEGYYLGRLQQALDGQANGYLGLDISRDAIRMAAKRYPKIDFVVANLKDPLPLRDAALQFVLNVFAPRNVTEFARILVSGCWLLVVIPEPAHLRELRERLQLLQIEEQKQQHVIEQFSVDFSLVQTLHVQHSLHLKGEEIVQTVMMTPNYWHMEPEKQQALTALSEIETEAAFSCLLFQRNGI